jgi:DNA repair protein RadC
MNTFEKFPTDELMTLRDELRQSGIDCFQSAELLATFLVQHGYGVSQHEARVAASRIEQVNFALPRLQEELEKIAWTM